MKFKDIEICLHQYHHTVKIAKLSAFKELKNSEFLVIYYFLAIDEEAFILCKSLRSGQIDVINFTSRNQ